MIDSKSLRLLGWSELVSHWIEFAHTVRGANRIKEQTPFATKQKANARSLQIVEARKLLVEESFLPFGGISDIKEFVVGCQKGVLLEKVGLINIGQTMGGLSRLRTFVLKKKEDVPRLSELFDCTTCFESYGQSIDSLFDGEGEFLDNASPGLSRARREFRRIKKSIEDTTRELIHKKNKLDVLQENFWTLREDRLVLPIKVSDKNLVSGIVHGRSKSGNTVFIEPSEIVDLNNQLKNADAECEKEEFLILQKHTKQIGSLCPELLEGLEVSVELDLLDAAARLARTLSAHPIEYSDVAADICLLDAKHPMMELSDKICIANDILFKEKQNLLITGPNAGGKTVCLKTLGLNVLMGQAGLHPVVGPKSQLPWFEDLFVVIGDDQNIENELSTFSAHLLQLKTILNADHRSSLILIDEICGATSPGQGAAMAQAFFEEMIGINCRAFVTTHYDSLKAFAADCPSMENSSVGFDLETLGPTYKLNIGTPGSSAAIELAERTGLPNALVARTRELIGGDANSVEKLLSDLEETREQLLLQKDELDNEKAKTLNLQRDLNQRLDKVREKVEKEHRRKHGDALHALTEARLEIEKVRKVLPNLGKQALKEKEKDLVDAAKQVRLHEPAKDLDGVDLPFDELRCGDQVFLKNINNWATVVSLESKNNFQVSIGMMNAKAKFSDVKKVKKKTKGSKSKKTWKNKNNSAPTFSQQDEIPYRTSVSTLDIRGFRVDDGESALDRFIDESLLAGREVCFVIHGHGTGALRKCIRSFAKSHPSVSKQSPAEQNDGGDGVTVLWLRS